MTTFSDAPTLWDSATFVTHRRPSKEERFAQFHEKNPWVMTELARRVRSYMNLGVTYVGVKRLMEDMRAEHAVDVHAVGDFRFDNSITSIYARKLIENEPDFAKVIRTRGKK